MASATILDEIVAHRRRDVEAARRAVPEAALRERIPSCAARMGFVSRLRRDAPMALIAEVKRASPSKGDIAPGMDAAAQALRYARGGASGISVLTEPTWFKGSMQDMLSVRRALEPLGEGRPGVLCKDFIIDRYQLVEAAVHGADAALLIVACLGDAELGRLIADCRGLGMEPLVEVNNAEEARRAVAAGATLVGINNRDLRNFNVDLSTTERLAGMLPAHVLVAALSGVSTRADVERFGAAGAAAVLVGESLMVAPDPAAKITELLGR